MFNIGPTELIVILIVALVVVGPKRLPEVGKTIGKSLREFRKAQDDLKSSFKFDLDGSDNAAPENPQASWATDKKQDDEPASDEASAE